MLVLSWDSERHSSFEDASWRPPEDMSPLLRLCQQHYKKDQERVQIRLFSFVFIWVVVNKNKILQYSNVQCVDETHTSRRDFYEQVETGFCVDNENFIFFLLSSDWIVGAGKHWTFVLTCDNLSVMLNSGLEQTESWIWIRWSVSLGRAIKLKRKLGWVQHYWTRTARWAGSCRIHIDH